MRQAMVKLRSFERCRDASPSSPDNYEILATNQVHPISPEAVVPPSEKVSDVSPTKSFPRSNNISCTNTPETENRLDIHLETLHAHLDTCAVANIQQIDGIKVR